MSGAAQGNTGTAKNTAADNKDESKPQQPQKVAAQLEEDDEFEDFPFEDWPKEEEVGANGASDHLWEESWDDDDMSEDFAVQLKEELSKMESQRKK